MRLEEKSEDNILIVGFESHRYPFMGDYFPLKGNNFPLIGIIFGHDRILSMEEIFHFNRFVVGNDFPLSHTWFVYIQFFLNLKNYSSMDK